MYETKSPLAGLVLFMVGLAIFGSMVAGVHYLTVDLPRQENIQTPQNDIGPDFGKCIKACGKEKVICEIGCGTNDECLLKCDAAADVCKSGCVL